MRNHVKLLNFVEHRVTVPRPDLVQYNPAGRWPWLQRQLLNFLEKLGCRYDETVVTYTTVPIEPVKAIDHMLEHIEGLQQFFGRYEPDHVFMGSRDYDTLVNRYGDPSQLPPGPFSMSSEYWKGRTAFGLKITVVPWMEGYLVVPKSFDSAPSVSW